MYEKTPLLSDTLSDKPFASIIAHILYGHTIRTEQHSTTIK